MNSNSNEHEQAIIIEGLKGNTKKIDLKELVTKRHDELHDIKKSWLGRQQTATQEKFFKEADAEVKRLESFMDEMLKDSFPDDKNSWRYHYDFTILITRKETE
jgi:hypothetical protein